MPNQSRRLCWGNLFIVKLQFQKRSAVELVSRTIPQGGGYDTPQRTRELFSRITLGFIPAIIIALFGLLSTQANAASFHYWSISEPHLTSPRGCNNISPLRISMDNSKDLKSQDIFLSGQ
jgi:hypothetical protein